MADTCTKTPAGIGYFDDPAGDLPPRATGGILRGPDGRVIYWDNLPSDIHGVGTGIVIAEAVVLVICLIVLLHGAYRKLPALVAWLRR